MNGLLRQGRAWFPVLKSAVLFLLPLPLLVALVVALFKGEIAQIAILAGALAALFTAAALTWRALVAEARFFLGQRLDPPAVPLKLASAVLTAAGACLAAAAGGHGIAGMVAFATLAAVGHVCFYGRDPERRSFVLPILPGVDRAEVMAQLKQAYGRLQGIDAAGRAIAVPEFRERLHRINTIGMRILAEIERDPRDATRARRFMNVYLDSAERITAEYARTHRQILSRPLEQNFRELLVEMEQTFESQHRKLLENDALSLDVEIEVLNARLKREGIN